MKSKTVRLFKRDGFWFARFNPTPNETWTKGEVKVTLDSQSKSAVEHSVGIGFPEYKIV